MRRIPPLLALLVTAAVAGPLARTGAGARSFNPLSTAVVPPQAAFSPPAPSAKDPRLDSHLARLVAANRDSVQKGHPVTAADMSGLDRELADMATAGAMRIDGDGRVQVYIDAARDVSGAADAARLAGGEIEFQDEKAGIVQARVPIGALEALAAAPSVRFIRLPEYAVFQAGSVTTQGDSLLKADLARAAFGIDGSRVKVGVISGDVHGLSASQASCSLQTCDLPPAVNTSTCNVTGGDPTAATGSPPGEGTAMLEIVHDLAPGAELWFGYITGPSGGGTGLAFNAAVDCLAAHTDVVVDDLAFFNQGPYDGTSYISANTSQDLNKPANPIRVYTNSVGNFQEKHYQEPYSTCTLPFYNPNLHLFQATANTQDLVGFGPRCSNVLAAAPGEKLQVVLQWDDPWGASCNDYDMYLYLFGDTITVLASSTNPQTCSQNPTESLTLVNTTAQFLAFDLYVLKQSGAARTLDMFVLPESPNFLTRSSSVANEGDAGGGVISAGAIDADDPGTDTIAAYSSWGPTNDGRTKPEITAISKVSVTGAGGFPSTFSGTSAASPHIGGIAALLLQCRPNLRAGEPGDNPAADRTAIRNAILNYAVDLGVAGVDNVYGSGRADALASANATCPATPIDTDGDGWKDGDEVLIGTNSDKPCGVDGWPANLFDTGPSANKLDVQDIVSFIAPVRRLNTSPGNPNFSARWDLVPGKGIFPEWINVQDMTALIAGATGSPPMFNGQRAFNQTCPFPP